MNETTSISNIYIKPRRNWEGQIISTEGAANGYSPIKLPPSHFTYTKNKITQQQEEPKKSGKRTSKFNAQYPPFGLDEERYPVEDIDVARGYLKGGPKEARLFRVALLANTRDVDHLFSVMVTNIHLMTQEHELEQEFKIFGEIGNIYIPRDGISRKTLAGFAVVRFSKKEAADRALIEGRIQLRSMFSPEIKQCEIVPISPQTPVFTLNSGVHGMTNTITGDMIKQET